MLHSATDTTPPPPRCRSCPPSVFVRRADTYRRYSRCMTAPTPSFAAPCITSRCASATGRTRCPPSDSSPAPTLQRRLRSPGSRAAVRFGDFPPPGAAAARRVHFAPQQPAEQRWEPFSPGTPPGVFACPAAVLNTATARPACNRRAPSRFDLEAWGEPCRGIITATSQAKPSTPPPPRHYCACVGVSSHMCLCFPTVTPPTEIYVQYFTASSIDRTLPRMPPPHW